MRASYNFTLAVLVVRASPVPSTLAMRSAMALEPGAKPAGTCTLTLRELRVCGCVSQLSVC